MNYKLSKRLICSILSAQVLFTSAMADVPRLPRDEAGNLIDFAKINGLDESQRAQFGAFMLFYELVNSGKIGGQTGLCLSYKEGGNGLQDRISIGLDSKSYPTGIASLNEVPVEKLNNLKNLLKEIGGYLDSGCKNDNPVDCKAGRSVKITGYADGQNYGTKGISSAKAADKPALIAKSIDKNISLSKDRAQMFAALVNGEGFVNPNAVQVEGKVSPIGEYLQHKQPIPAKYLTEDQKKLPNGGFSLDTYKVNCPERRVTVIDVNFNAQKSNIDMTPGSISPMLRASSKEFVKRTNLSASVQTYKAFNVLSKEGKLTKIKDDKDTDKLIDKILEMNGVKNEKVKAACKNLQVRTMVKEHLKMVNNLSPDARKKIESSSELELLKTVQQKKLTGGALDVQKWYTAMNDGYGGSNDLALDPLIKSPGGETTTLNDCFSAKAAMQVEFDEARDLKAVNDKKGLPSKPSLCQPVADHMDQAGNLSVQFDPAELHDHKVLHIGCGKCQTGFRYVPKKYTNPETKKEETHMVPVFIDREADISDKANPELTSYRPVEKSEVEDLVKANSELKRISEEKLALAVADVAKAKPGKEKIAANAKKRFLETLLNTAKNQNPGDTNVIELNPVAPGKPETSFLMGDINHPKYKEMLISSGIEMDMVVKSRKVVQLIKNPKYGKIESDYVRERLAGRTNDITKRYEEVILPGIKARDVLTNWDGTNQSATQDKSFLFGSLKKPRYYLLENCDCNSENLIEQAEQKGTVFVLGEIPEKVKNQKVNKNACMISMPVPPSCMVAPNEQGTAEVVTDPKGEIEWMGLNGKNVHKFLSDMNQHFIDSNKSVKLTGCEGLSPLEIAERIVESAECSGENKIPQGEAIDCKK